MQFLSKNSREKVKLTKMVSFEKFVSPKNSREARIQAGSRTSSYNPTESTLPIASYHVLTADKGLNAVMQRFQKLVNDVSDL